MTKVATSRLDKLLANLGYASRREIQLLARNGHIRLDGVPLPKADMRIALTPDLETRLIVDGEALDPLPGVALMVNLAIGLFTPPVGINLFVAANITKMSLEKIALGAVPFLITSLIGLAIIAAFPELSHILLQFME